MPWKEQVGLSYSLGLPHFFLEHRVICAAEEQMFKLATPLQPEGKSLATRQFINAQSKKT
jgi:hypothetical protein